MNQPQDQVRRLGPYTITRKLGEGGMGAVYLGRHTVLDVDHAIKVLPPRLAQNQQFIERFLREARHAARLNHPHIVQVVGADKYGETRYIAMQFVPGESLERMVRSGGPMLPHRAVRYCYHVAQALAYAHNAGMIHRDVKPDNVLVDESDNARLTDFGLVREMNADPEGAGLTQSGAVLGTPFYMSPEQWRNEGVDHRSDVYALGVMLYYMLTRRFPYPGEGPAQILRRQIEGRFDPITQHVKTVDENLVSMVHRAIDVNAESRTQTAHDLAAEMIEWWAASPDNGGLTLDTSVCGTVIRTNITRSNAGSPMPTGMQQSSITPPGSGATLLESTSVSDVSRQSGARSAVSGIGAPPPPPPPGMTSNASGLQFNTQGSQGGGTPQMIMTSAGPAYLTGTGTPMPGQTFVTLTDPSQQKQMRVIIGLVVVALVAVAVGVAVMLSGGASSGKADPELEIGIPSGSATETSPLFVNATTWAIPGSARGSVTVNGKPYELGRAVELGDELNTLEVVVTGENGRKLTRTLFIYHDCEVPGLKVTNVADVTDGRLSAAESFDITGKVRDLDPKVELHLRRGDVEQTLPLRNGGEFSVRLEVQREPVAIQLQAKDRSGNVSSVVEFTVEFAPVRIDGINLDTGGPIEVRDPREPITVTGQLNTGRSVTMKLDGKPLDAKINAETGEFSFQWIPGTAGKVGFVLTAMDSVRGEGPATDVRLDIRRKVFEKIEQPEGAFPEYRRLTDGMVCVQIPAGEYKRGAPDEFNCGDAALKTIELSSYLIDKFEVSNAQFARFLNEGGKMMTRLEPDQVNGPLIDPANCKVMFDETSGTWMAQAGLENHPVVAVTFKGASEYAKWSDPYGGTLPSEARWEAAARGKAANYYPWGNDVPDYETAQFRDAGIVEGAPLEVNNKLVEKGKSPFGLRMMAGNVEEWCLDFYNAIGYLDATGPDPVVTRPPSGEAGRRVVRGGSFKVPDRPLKDLKKDCKPDEPSNLASFSRACAPPASATDYRGFRCAASTPDSRR